MLNLILYSILLLVRGCIITALAPADVTDTLYTNCPLTNFTHRERIELKNATHIPCCASCVTTNCGVRAPCCPDYKIKRMASECISVLQPMVFHRYKFQGYDKVRFWMVTTCNPMFVGTLQEQNCLNRRIEDPFNITFVQPVVESYTKIIFANKFCAFCNGVNESSLEPDIFQPSVRCFIYSRKSSVLSPQGSIEQSLRSGDCFYFFMPESPEYVYESQCVNYDYQTCNVTGVWEAYDQLTEEACETYDLPYIHLNTISFKNFHCFLCNGNSPEQKNDVCRNVGILFASKSFSVILGKDVNDKKPMEGRSRSTDEICLANQIWDSMKAECRDVVCPGTKLMTEAGCISFLTSLRDIVWTINILWVIPVDKSIKTEQFKNLTTEYAIDHLNRSFSMKYADVLTHLEISIYAHNFNDIHVWVFAFVRFLSSEHTEDNPATEFIKEFRRLPDVVYNRSGISVVMKGSLLDDSVAEAYTYEALVYGQLLVNTFRYTQDRVDSNYALGPQLVAKPTIKCDLVFLESDEYSLSMYDSLIISRNNLKISKLEYVIDYERNGVLVCVEDFLFCERQVSISQEPTESKVLIVISYITTCLTVAVFL